MIDPAVLTIAGSDSGGNAGVQADLRAFHAYKLHGSTVFAALTAQNPFGVKSIFPVSAEFVADQLDAVLGVYNIKALKTGMLAESSVIEVVADKLKAYPEIKKVIDPVMVATSGAKLISETAISTLKACLLPLATIITPNLPEAEVLLGHKITSIEELREGAKALYDQFGAAVLIKGGHTLCSAQEEATDTLYDGKDFSFYSLERIENPISTHGTGCTLAAALASELALGANLKEAVEGAKAYVYKAIKFSHLVGNNCGVLA